MIATKRRLKMLARRNDLRRRRKNGALPHGTPGAKELRKKILKPEPPASAGDDLPLFAGAAEEVVA